MPDRPGARTLDGPVHRGGRSTAQRGSAVDEDDALPAHVAELFRELGGVLENARDRLDALLRDGIPVQDTRTPMAEPDIGGR